MPVPSSGPVVLGASTRRLNPAAVAGAAMADSSGCQICTDSRLGSTEQAASSAETAHEITTRRAGENNLGTVMLVSSVFRREFGRLFAAEQIAGRIGLQLAGQLVDVAQGRTQFAQCGADLVHATQPGLQRTLVVLKQFVEGLRGLLQRCHCGR